MVEVPSSNLGSPTKIEKKPLDFEKIGGFFVSILSYLILIFYCSHPICFINQKLIKLLNDLVVFKAG